MTPGVAGRPNVGIVADDAVAAMLAEWLQAAGFTPLRGAAIEDAFAVLWRWPTPFPLHASRRPVVVLHDAGGPVPDTSQVAVAEFVAWPDSSDARSLLEWSSQLFTLLRRLASSVPAPPPSTPPPAKPSVGEARAGDPELIAIGVSTGGPLALRELLSGLAGADLPPLAIVQHIPPAFVAELAARLQRQTGYRCEGVVDGQGLQRGVAYFAATGNHLCVVQRGGVLQGASSEEPPRRGHRPAADVLFESCARLPIRGVGVVMTGMGRDGAEGLLQLRQRGWATFGQDEASCAIYGMPRAAKALGAVQRELSLAELAPALVATCRRALSPVTPR